MTLLWEDVSVRLAGAPVLSGVTLEARRGELLAIVGPNGAGKSTLLRSAVGLAAPSTGRVTWEKTDMAACSSRARARLVGLVPQVAHLDHPFTVREAISMGRFAHVGRLAEPRPVDHEAVQAALAATALVGLADRPVTRLSGGERQRVLLARVLAQDPAAFLLDEPTANLDLGQAHRTIGLMRQKAASGAVVVAVLHDLELAARVADRVALFAAGRLVAVGTPEEALREEALEQAFRTPVAVTWHDGEARVRVA